MNLRPSRRDDELPDDLDALGAALERAARRQLARRRLLGRLAQGAAIVLIAGPLALAILSDDLTPSSTPVATSASAAVTGPLIEGAASSSFFAAHIPDELPPPAGYHPCLDGLDCVHVPPVGKSSPAPEAKP